MNKLPISQQVSEVLTQEPKITSSLILAFERTKTDLFDFTQMVYDIKAEFKFLKDEEIQQAIKKGSLGVYGRTYKLSTQEVCIWIREYLKEKNKNRSI